MAACAHKGGRCSCSAPTSVAVAGHYRVVKGRKKKRAPAKPKGRYFVAEDTTGRTCDHHHRTRAGARRCATAQQRKESVHRARNLTRKQAKATRVRRWDVTEMKP